MSKTKEMVKVAAIVVLGIAALTGMSVLTHKLTDGYARLVIKSK